MRGRLIWIAVGSLLITLCIRASIARASDAAVLFFQPRIGYQSPRVFQNSQIANYPGTSYGAELFYRILEFGGGGGLSGDGSFGSSPLLSIAPVVGFHYGKFDNSANTASQQESLTEKTFSAGLKIYISHFFVKGQYVWVDLRDNANGTRTATIQARASGLAGALGINFPISNRIGIELSAEIMNANFAPESGGFSTPTQYLRFGGFFGLSIAIPSSVNSSDTAAKRMIKDLE